MLSVFAILKKIYLPYLIFGTMGIFLMLYRFDKHKRKILLSVLICIAMMFIWRMTRRDYNSTRYSENLFAFFAFCSAFFLCFWDYFFQKTNSTLIYLKTTRILMISFCCLYLIYAFFHYNPYSNYNLEILACIQKEKPDNRCVVVATTSGYPYRIEGIDFFTAPGFLYTSREEHLLNIIRQYQFRYQTLYIVSNSSLEKNNLPQDDLRNISMIGAFQKNRKGKMAYVFKYVSPELDRSLVINSAPVDSTSPGNLLRNSGFETLYPHKTAGSYYEKIQNSRKKGIIPDNQSFPESWDIYYGIADKDTSSTSIFATDHDAISGRYSMLVKSKKKFSFLYESSFPKGEYLFQCDFRPISKSSFELQLSLRDEKSNYYGDRELEKITMDIPNQLYHYQIRLTKDMVYPFQKFYLYFMFDAPSDILIDNVSLTEISE